ncbi:MAG: hypothetical protein J7M38_09080, partial [Armatimonadetes bacterium]|nr:hypothetical protein [Armatimonadota bacterium]
TPLPGRVMPDYAAVWPGAEPFVHRAGAASRLRAGDLPLLVCPTAVDLACVDGEGAPPLEAPHLRLERDGILQWGPPLIEAHLQRQVELELPIKSLVVMTHNTRDYGDPAEPARQALDGIAAAITASADRLGLVIRPVTLAELATEVL